MVVLVTGGAGYIGTHVVLELIKQKHQVIVLDDLSTGNEELIPQPSIFYQGSQLDKNFLESIFVKHKIDVVMHFSAKLIVSESVTQPLNYYENNLGGLFNILSLMEKYDVKNIVFSSTAAVYGNLDKDLIEEDDLKEPINPYGKSKLYCENLIKDLHKIGKINYAIFRYFNVAGADSELRIGQNTKNHQITHLVPSIVQSIINNKTFTIFGNDYPTKDKTCVRDYIHVSDLARAHVLGMDYVLQNKSNVFNLGSGQGFSVLEVVKEVEQVLNQKIDYAYGPKREGDPAKLIASIERAKKELNFYPEFSLKQMIESDLNWRKKINKIILV